MAKLELSKWLTKEDIKGDTKAEFTDAGNFVEQEFEGKKSEAFVIGVSLSLGGVPAKRLWTMNKTSQRAVASHFGLDTDKWVGQSVILFLADTQVAGKMKKVIYAREKE